MSGGTPISSNPNPIVRAEENARVPVDPEALARAGSSSAQQALTGLQNASIKEAIVSEELQTMLRQAGLQRTTSGAVAVLDTKGTGATDGLSALQQVYGTGESQLAPAMPPKVELTPQTVTDAQTFAQNFDLAMNNYLLTQNPTGPNPVAASGVGATTLSGPAGSGQLYYKSLSELSSDDLLAAFLKVNINDPNNDPEMHNKLHAIATNMRQLAIDEAKKRIERAQEAKKEAEQYAQQAEYISTMVTVVSLAASVFTMGSSLLAATAAQGAVQAAATTASSQITQQAAQIAADQVKNLTLDQLTTLALEQGMNQAMVDQIVQQGGQEALRAVVQQNMTNQLATQMAANLATGTLPQGSVAGLNQAGLEAAQQSMQSTMQEVVANLPAEELQRQLGSQWQEKFMTQLGDEVGSQVTQQLQTQTQQVLQQNLQGQLQQQLQEQMTQSVSDQMSQAAAQAAQAAQEATTNAAANASAEAGLNQGANAATDAGAEAAQGTLNPSQLNQHYTGGMDTSMNGSLWDRGVQSAQSYAGEPNTTLKNVGVATSVGGKVVEGGANYEAAMKEADAAEWRNEAKRWELTADHHQDQIEEEGQIMQEIMESKNKTVDAVMSMMNASFVSKQKLMAANMTR